MMADLRLRADMYINTSETNVHQLRQWFGSHLSALVGRARHAPCGHLLRFQERYAPRQ